MIQGVYFTAGDMELTEAHARRIGSQKQIERGIANQAFDARPEFETLRIGLLGELAAAKYFGLLPEFTDPKVWWSDDGGDLRANGRKLQIKATRSKSLGFCVSRPEKEKSWLWDIGVLVQVDEAQGLAKMVGVISNRRFREVARFHEKGSPGFPHAGAYMAERTDLFPASDLRDFLNREAGK